MVNQLLKHKGMAPTLVAGLPVSAVTLSLPTTARGDGGGACQEPPTVSVHSCRGRSLLGYLLVFSWVWLWCCNMASDGLWIIVQE